MLIPFSRKPILAVAAEDSATHDKPALGVVFPPSQTVATAWDVSRLTVACAGRRERRFPTAGNGAWESADPFGLDRRDAPPTERNTPP